MVLNNEEMLTVTGGSKAIIGACMAVIGGIFVFLTGVLEGVLHPKKC